MTENFFGLHDITSESAHKQTNTNIELYIQLNPVYEFVSLGNWGDIFGLFEKL